MRAALAKTSGQGIEIACKITTLKEPFAVVKAG
jgi:hypothetical protein